MDIKKARVFVVDDDRMTRTLVVNQLRRLGVHDFYAYEDGKSALIALIKLRPDLILTDIHMSGMNGIELVRKLRTIPHELLARTKVVFMSADASKETITEALPLGIEGYLVKPSTLDTLEARLQQALKNHGNSGD